MLMDGIFNVEAAVALPYNVWEVVQCGIQIQTPIAAHTLWQYIY